MSLLARYTRNRLFEVPLKLGFNYKPMWSSTPNTHLVPGLDSKLPVFAGKVVKKERPKGYAWHTLPVDAFSLKNLSPPLLLQQSHATMGRLHNPALFPLPRRPRII